MKRISLLLASLFVGTALIAQSVCENFDNIPQSKLLSNGGNDGGHAFHVYGNLSNGGCSGGGTCYLSNWEVVNGAPSVFWYQQVSSITPHSDSNCVFLNTDGRVSPQKTDGIAYKYNFATGSSYNVSMALRTFEASAPTTDLNIEFYLLPNALPYTYSSVIGASPIVNVPSGAIKVHTKANFVSNGAWTMVNFQIPASMLTSSFSRLWIRQTNNSTTGDLSLLIDDFCIAPAADVVCENFDNIPQAKLLSNGGNDGGHAFHVYGNTSNGGCTGGGTCYLNNWEVVNGAPSVLWYQEIPGVTPVTDSNCVILNTDGRVSPQKTDGIAFVHNFNSGNDYTVSMALRTYVASAPTTDLNIEFYLLPNALPYAYSSTIGASPIVNVPTGALKVYTKANFVSSSSWSTVSFTIPGVSLSSNYTRLWIRQTNNSTTGDLSLALDSFCVKTNTVSAVIDIDNTTQAGAVLYQNYPNPFNAETTIPYTIAQQFEKASIVVTDVAGRMVQQYPIYTNGNGAIVIKNGVMQDGMYIYSIVLDGKTIQSKRMLIAQ